MAAEHDVTVQIGDVYQAAAPLAAAALHQLPPPPGDFTGRTAELKELMQAIEQGGVTISGLRGMGGIGKTALALKLAERLRERYPDAQIYLDLKGTSDKPLRTAEAMAHVVRAYQPAAKPPDNEAELAALYHSLLDGQRALLLMDNAASAGQVAPLAPPASCVLLVTSRHHFVLRGWVAKDLTTLAPEEARALLLRLAARIDGAADQIAQLCGYLPLALCAAGGTLAAREDLTPHRYAEQLRDERQRLERLGTKGVEISVEASFNLSYASLEPEAARAFRQLAVFPGTFDAAAEEVVCKDPEHARLSELLRRSLVEYDPAAERYWLHDLVRLFATARLSDQERGEAERRHAARYLEVASAAQVLYLSGGDAILAGLRLFDTEWANIRSGQAWAAARAQQEVETAKLCNAFAGAAPYCLGVRLHPREHIKWLEPGLVASRRLKDRRAECAHLSSLGIAYRQLGEPRRAIQYCEQALAIHPEIGDRRGEGLTVGSLGAAHADLGEVHRAIECYERWLLIAREIGDRRCEGAAVGNLGIAYRQLGEPHRAIEYHEQALAIHREIGDRRGEGNALGNLGNVYAQSGEPHRAIEYHQQALAIHREIGDRRGEGNALGNLGNACLQLGDPHRALEHHEQALAIDREIGDRRGEAANLFNMSLAFYRVGERPRAIASAQAALKICVDVEDPHAEMVRSKLAEWGVKNSE